MRKKTTVIGVFLGIFLMGIVSSLVVPYLSNTLTGTVVVHGPVYYAAPGNELTLNEPINIINVYNLNGIDSEKFWSNEFSEPLDFYPMEVTMQVRARVEEGELPKEIELTFGYKRGDNSPEICNSKLNITSSDFETYETTCINTKELEGVEGFYYHIETSGTDAVEYEVQVGDTGTRAGIEAK